MQYDVLALAAVLVAGLAWLYRAERRRIGAARRALFDDCLDLVQDPTLSQDDVDFPVLTGGYRGHRVRLQLLADHVVVRKVPSLWLLATVYDELPMRSVVDLLARPQNTEFYSPAAVLDVELPLPLGWPRHATLRTDDPDGMPPLAVLNSHVGMFEDAKTKELLVSPRGVRIVYQADQAKRANYMVLRQLVFERARLDPTLVARLLDRGAKLCADLKGEGAVAWPTRRASHG